MAIDTILLLLGGVAFGAGVVLLVGAPRFAGTVAGRSARPESGRRASGPDRMRSLIASQQASRSRQSSLGRRLRGTGIGLVGAGTVAFLAGVAMRAAFA